MSTRLTLALPPLSQLNTPYPSIAYLARALREVGRTACLRDLGLEVILALFSRAGLVEVFDHLQTQEALPEPAWRALSLRAHHEQAIGPAIRFLQGKDPTLATRIVNSPLLPRGQRLDALDLSRFGEMGTDGAARYLATLYLEDLADLVTSCVDTGFSLAQYQHHLASGPIRFEPLLERLEQTTLIDRLLDARTDALLTETRPDVVGISVPFPGMLIGALRMGRRLKAAGTTVILGGGYVTTELRDVAEPRLFDFIDALTYDDGEGPLLALLEHREGGPDRRHRTRTVEGLHSAEVEPRPFTSAAWYGDLPLGDHLQVLDTLNPTHRLWSDGRWNKVTLAHGCYWKRCAFCDVNLDYISRFEPARISSLVDAMAELVEHTGQSGFHLVDEAAPPRLMRDLALELLDRKMSVSWWGNIRFERSFTPDLCRLLAASGLICVTGGLEVASDRLLKAMDKGITVNQAAQAASAFTEAGVQVHAYLMYGFPTQTEQETVDAMEIVRQMFDSEILSSAFWHRFVLTRHAPIHADPAAYGVQLGPLPEGPLFATNDLPHIDAQGADPDRFDRGLVHALEAWMRGEELERPVHIWFDPPLCPTSEAPRRIARTLAGDSPMGERLIWLGGEVLESTEGLTLHHADGHTVVGGRSPERAWLTEVLDAARPGEDPLTLADAIGAFPGEWSRFDKRWQKVREAGLVGV